MDGASIKIGDQCFYWSFLWVLYSESSIEIIQDRNQGLEKALPIKVGDNCWFGADVSVMPGVTIGAGCVIAAGAVVTKDMPDK